VKRHPVSQRPWSSNVTASEYVVDVLGGPRVFTRRALPTPTELRDRIRQGLPYRSLESVRERLRLSGPEVAAILHIPDRTMARRRQARRLRADESDRLYRVARVAGVAVSALGSEDKAATWLHRPNRALNGELPIRLLDTNIGAHDVEDVLGRIEHRIVG
jgi:putative toxin-antitoxin system antitoxin component (TIGR02293 family)